MAPARVATATKTSDTRFYKETRKPMREAQLWRVMDIMPFDR